VSVSSATKNIVRPTNTLANEKRHYRDGISIAFSTNVFSMAEQQDQLL
jgi:hypothetical protein